MEAARDKCSEGRAEPEGSLRRTLGTIANSKLKKESVR